MDYRESEMRYESFLTRFIKLNEAIVGRYRFSSFTSYEFLWFTVIDLFNIKLIFRCYLTFSVVSGFIQCVDM